MAQAAKTAVRQLQVPPICRIAGAVTRTQNAILIRNARASGAASMGQTMISVLDEDATILWVTASL
ncbi:MAG: hypothetical protein WBN04_05730 [Paracoccaceae bacterium]